MNFIAWLVVGGIIGWLADHWRITNRRQGVWGREGVWESVVIGMVGALFGAYIFGPFTNGATLDQIEFSFISLALSFVGAAALLMIVKKIKKPTPHR